MRNVYDYTSKLYIQFNGFYENTNAYTCYVKYYVITWENSKFSTTLIGQF